MANISTIPRITSKELSEILLSECTVSANFDESVPSSKTAVVDVRDNDYIGGHIKYSIHAPTITLNATMSDLVRTLEDKELVVFHCVLSQQRGPNAALKYLREREKFLSAGTRKSKSCETNLNSGYQAQRVVILDKGFDGWQREYGNDTRLTEGFVASLWG